MAFEARMKSGIPVKWRISTGETVINPEGKQYVKPGKVIITRQPDDSWSKSMDEFEKQYNVNKDGTGSSKGGGPWYSFIWDEKGGSNKDVSWGPNTSYINTEGTAYPRAKKEFDMYYERKPHSMGTSYNSFTAPK